MYWWNKLVEQVWYLLPDKCEMPDCRRKGVRGNENRMPESADPRGYVVMCDYCSSAAIRKDQFESGAYL